MVIGISGYTGSGKTTAARRLHEKQPSFFLIDADKVARKLMLENEDLIREVGARFGVLQNSRINFTRLGEIVFESVENLKKLNAITFPYIIPAIENLLGTVPNAIIDAALLPLTPLVKKECKLLIWIESDLEKRAKRLQERTALDEKAIQNRIKKQIDLMPRPNKTASCNSNESVWKIIENNSSLEDLFKKVDEIL